MANCLVMLKKSWKIKLYIGGHVISLMSDMVPKIEISILIIIKLTIKTS